MKLRLLPRTGSAGTEGVTVTVDAEPSAPLCLVATRLRAAVCAPTDTPLFTEAGPLRLDGTLGDGQLQHGSIVGVGAAVAAPPPVTGPVLAVISGPDAGAYVPLRRGVTAIGRDEGCQLPLHDPDISRRHAVVTRDGEGVWLADAGSTNGTMVFQNTVLVQNTAPLESAIPVENTGLTKSSAANPIDETTLDEQSIKLGPHTPIRCGNTVLWLSDSTCEPLPTEATAAGTRELLRPPRLSPPPSTVTVDYPAKPHLPDPPSTPWLGVILSVTLPLILGVMLWWFMQRSMGGSMGAAGAGMLAFMALSPVLMLSHVLTDRWNRRRSKRTATADHAADIRAADEQLAQARTAELTRRREAFPDPFTVAAIAATPTTRLWERRTTDTDWLRLRVGLATLPAEFEVRGGSASTVGTAGHQPSHPELPLVPAVLDLSQIGVLGVAGADRLRLCQWLLAQLAVLHSPRQLRLVLLTDTDRDEWASASWLPHLHDDQLSGDDASTPNACGIAADPARRAAMVSALAATVKRRAAASQHHGVTPGDRDEPAVVLIYDSVQRLNSLPGGSVLLEHGPAQRIFTIYLDADPRALPEQCRGTVVLPTQLQLQAGASRQAVITHSDASPLSGVIPDLVGSWWFDRVARSLAPLRERLAAAAGTHIPQSVSFTSVLDATLLDVAVGGATSDTEVYSDTAQLAQRIVDRWQRQPPSTRAVIGADASGPIGIDIAADGPHALIAGTTGAGKSELLRTWLASLALGNRPDELNLLLIDYKGGSAFAECAKLPHVMGLVTDLDPVLTTRVLSSLRAELHRRERCLAAVGATDFQQYHAEQH
ncbi:MAG: FtsK/SpoIIIE domain-containing protein, partial [Mycobacteriales bacterium]